MIKLLFVFCLISGLRAEVLKLDITSRHEEYVPFKEACEFMCFKHNLLIEFPDLHTLDCMNNKFAVKDFCIKKFGSEYKILRGYVQPKLKEVACESGEQVMLSLACDKRDRDYCKDPKKGCEKLRETYAYSLKLYHHSFLEKDVDDVLNCYYGNDQNLPPKK